jgi:hypothetical protein
MWDSAVAVAGMSREYSRYLHFAGRLIAPSPQKAGPNPCEIAHAESLAVTLTAELGSA